MTEQPSMAELVKQTKETYGLTWQEMANQLGRSDRMIRKIANGETSGESFRTSITELYETGQVETLTPRRRTKSGQLAKVRSKKGASQKSVIPVDTRGKRAPRVARGKYSFSTTHLPAGNRLHQIEMPRTGKVGRQRGMDDFDNTLLKVTRSQAQADKRVKLSLTVEDPDGNRRRYEVGTKSGFHASDVRADIRTDHEGDAESWLRTQLSHVYPDTGSQRIVGIEINEHNAVRTKEVRKQEDQSRTRRRRWTR